MSRIIAFAFCASWVIAAAAWAELPRYDVEAHCERVARVSGGSEMIFNGCVEMEQDAYDETRGIWSAVPVPTANYCDQVARVSGGSYAILQGCIEMEVEAAGTRPTFRY